MCVYTEVAEGWNVAVELERESDGGQREAPAQNVPLQEGRFTTFGSAPS